MAGASAALHLARQGFDVLALVVERNTELGAAFSGHQMSIVGSEARLFYGTIVAGRSFLCHRGLPG
jgi:flavin-dependent dehydrogenase